jgi:hypothetical protein
MKRSDFTTPVSNLREAYESLEIAWREACEQWSDSAARNFDENYMAHIRPAVDSTVSAVSRMSGMLEQAVRECSDNQDRTYL